MRTLNVSTMARFYVSFPMSMTDRLLGKLARTRIAFHRRLIGFANSSTHRRPDRLLRNGRSPDQNFRRRDLLYHRCTREDVEDEVFLPARIRIDRPSVNWSKYSKTWDVIFDHPGHGIVRFIVGNLPRELPTAPPRPGEHRAELHHFYAFHDPLDLNYSHSEIRCSRGGRELARINSSAVKKEFQAMMSREGLLLLRPEI
jgi:hypothetical protein